MASRAGLQLQGDVAGNGSSDPHTPAMSHHAQLGARPWATSGEAPWPASPLGSAQSQWSPEGMIQCLQMGLMHPMPERPGNQVHLPFSDI